jgi:hypothetical protein
MSGVLKMVIITLCMNIMIAMFASMSGVGLGDRDVLQGFLDYDSSKIYETGYGITPTGEYNASIPTTLTTGSMGSGTSGFSFIDALKMVFEFMKLMIVTMFIPMYWGFALGMPMYMQLIIFVLQVTTIISLILAIRGIPT